MRIKRGTTARFTLTDGTTIEGIVRFGWWSGAFKLEKTIFFDARHAEPTPAAGIVWLPKRAVLFAQVAE